jgi:hypothetical protein
VNRFSRHGPLDQSGGEPAEIKALNVAVKNDPQASTRPPRVLDDAYFWATHQGAEIDLLLRNGERIFGVECKHVDAPAMTPSLRIALQDLKLERIAVVYPGPQRCTIARQVEAVPLAAICEGMRGLFPGA